MTGPPLEIAMDTFDDGLPLAQARTIPASWYLDPDAYRREREKIFGRCWLLVGREEQAGTPGKYFTSEVAGEPILVVRGEDGELRAFFNVCRHRAAKVACEPEGCAAKLRCHYHGWTYDLAGKLRGVPEFDGVEEFRREENGLVPLAVGTWAGLVWVHLGTPTVPLAEWVKPLERHDLPARMRPLRFVARREYPIACNWKVYCDNYLDGGYHINHIHPGLGSVIDYSGYRTEIDENLSVQISPLAQQGGDSSVAAVRPGDSAYYAWVFPNVMLNVYDGLMDVNIVLPEGPDRCRVLFDLYFAETEGDSARRFIDDSAAVTHQVQIEDVGICEEVQRGLGSRAFDTGRFSVRREAPVYHFHRLVARWLRESAPA